MQLSQIVQPRFNFAQLLTGVAARAGKQLPRFLVVTGQERAKVVTSVCDVSADELTLEFGERIHRRWSVDVVWIHDVTPQF
jgi:hypothetical protein